MICEFALEPELVATWHDRKKFLFFEEKFGLETRRIVSAYPKKWVSQVWQAFQNSPHSQDQNAEKNLDALLRDLTQNKVKRRSTFSEISVWLDRAEAEHAVRPFHAVLAKKNPRGRDFVVSADKLIAEGHPCWKVPSNPPVPRNAAELVAAVAPILRVCRRIVFIDPYFNSKKQRFMEPMAGYFQELWTNRYGENLKVELHTAIERFKCCKPDEVKKKCSTLIQKMQKRLPKIIPAGKEVHVTIWKERKNGRKLHNRFILSDICGVSFGTGLDQNNDPASNATDCLSMLNAVQFEDMWKEYLGTPAAFDEAVPPFKITGTHRE